MTPHPETPEGRAVTETVEELRDALAQRLKRPGPGLVTAFPALARADFLAALDSLLSDHQALREREAAMERALREIAGEGPPWPDHTFAGLPEDRERAMVEIARAALSQTKEEPK